MNDSVTSSSSTDSSKANPTEVNFRKVKLANVCPTKWVDRHVAIETSHTLFPSVVGLLIDLMQSKDAQCSTKSNLFYMSLSTSEFLCSSTIQY